MTISTTLQQISGIYTGNARLYWFCYRPESWDKFDVSPPEAEAVWEFFKSWQGRNRALARLAQEAGKHPIRALRVGDMSLAGLVLASDTPSEQDLLNGVKWPRSTLRGDLQLHLRDELRAPAWIPNLTRDTL